MTLQIRRVVTGHSPEGRAKVEIDENVKNVISNRPGASSSVIWATKGFPVNNDGFSDPTSGSFKTTVDGVAVKLKAGDVLVQRGTIHNWVNRGTEDCIIAFVLISATPVKAGTSSLEAVG